MKRIAIVLAFLACVSYTRGENNPAQFLANCWSQKAQMELDAKTQRINEENAKRRAEAQEKADRERAQVKQAIEAKAREQVAKKAAQEREDRRRKILGEGLYRSSKRKTLAGPVPILRPEPRPAKIKIWR